MRSRSALPFKNRCPGRAGSRLSGLPRNSDCRGTAARQHFAPGQTNGRAAGHGDRRVLRGLIDKMLLPERLRTALRHTAIHSQLTSRRAPSPSYPGSSRLFVLAEVPG
jgi:hypothetical protein